MTSRDSPQHRPATIAECLAVLKARHWEIFSPAERRELRDAIIALTVIEPLQSEIGAQTNAAAQVQSAPKAQAKEKEETVRHDTGPASAALSDDKSERFTEEEVLRLQDYLSKGVPVLPREGYRLAEWALVGLRSARSAMGVIEVCTDPGGLLLWAEPYLFKRLNVAGSSFIKDRIHYKVIASSFGGNIVRTTVSRSDSGSDK